MSVSLRIFKYEDLIEMDYEHSDRAARVTEIVELFCVNESAKSYEAFRNAATVGPRKLAEAVIGKFETARHGSSAWETACELAISDFRNGRIRWDEICGSLLSE